MGASLQHLIRHKPSGRLSYRRAYTPEMRSSVPGLPRELKVSLGSADITAPDAAARFEAAKAQYAALERRAGKIAGLAYDELNAPLIAFLADSYLAAELAIDERGRRSPGSRHIDPRPYTTRPDPECDWAVSRECLDRYDGDGDLVAHWREWVIPYAASLGYVIKADGEAFTALCRAIGTAAANLWLQLDRRIDGEVTPTPDHPIAPQRGKARLVLSMLETFDAYSKATGMSVGVAKEWRSAVARLSTFLGHDDVAAITAPDVMRWRDNLLAGEKRHGGARDPLTVRKTLAGVKAMLTWAVQEQRLTANVAAQVIVRAPRKPKLRERAFTPSEAKAILTASLVPVKGRMADTHKLARRWIPWLCAYTGSRVNEMSQLRGRDVALKDGVWTIHITPEAGTVKTGEARTVPMHEHLVAQGFPEVVKALGDGPLFYDPGRQRSVAAGNRHTKKVGERIGAWVRKDVGITDPGVAPNHGWRHTFKTAAYAADIQEAISSAIQGHAAATVGRSYNATSLRTMADAMARIPRFEVDGGGTDPD